LAVKDVRRQPSRYGTLVVATALFTFLALALVSLGANFASEDAVSRALGHNTYDVAITRVGPDGPNSEDWLVQTVEAAQLPEPVAFASSMQQVSLGTEVGTIVGTVSHRLPGTQPIRDGRAPGAADEVLLAAGLSVDLGALIGDTVLLDRVDGREAQFTVVGIYETVNQTGLTLWLTDAGYRRLDPRFEARAFALNISDDATHKEVEAAIAKLNAAEDVIAVPGKAAVASLIGTVQSAINGVLATFAATALVIAAVVSFLLCLASVAAETRELAMREVLGTTRRSLRRQLALRFGLTALIGSVLGSGWAAAASGPLLGSLLSTAGLSSLRLDLPSWGPVSACLALTTLAFAAAILAAGTMPTLSPRTLSEE
jgi:putative ABC transport system permease protein